MDPEHHRREFLGRLYTAFTMIRSVDEAEQFLNDLCTPQELSAMADRWRVVQPIKAGVPYRQIYDETGVSVTTIGRVARCITYGTGGYNLIFRRQIDAERTADHDSDPKTG
jgi:TrpR-related protein YerC/YecD